MPTPTFSGASYQLNPNNETDSQNSPAVAALDDGRFATVYRSSDTLGGTLRYVIHNSDGSVYREQTIVGDDNDAYVDNGMVDIAALAGGGFVVAWVEGTSSDENLYHRVYGADGQPLTGRIHTNADATDGTARRPDVIGDGKGGFYIVWDDSGFDSDPGPGQTSTRSVRMQHFGADGQPTVPSAMLSDDWGADSNASVAVNRDGSRVNVIWDDDLGYSPNANQEGIYGIEIGGIGSYRADGDLYSDFHTDPDVAYSTGNTFMAVWNKYISPGVYQVFGSINDGPEFQVNTSAHTHSFTGQQVVGLRDGNFLVVWNDDGFDGNDDVLGQLISASGEKIGSEFTISDRTSTYISRITASETIDGRVIVTWSSSDGSSEVYGRMVDPRQGALDWTGDGSSENVAGTTLADTLDGGAGDDRIEGLAGADTISGGDGDDMVNGGGGLDVLGGGLGRDVFVFASVQDSMKGGIDSITDFARGQDDIDLHGIDANEDRRGNQAFDFIGREKFHKEAGELRFEGKDGSATIAGDTDGDGKADFLLVLEGVGKVKASDFIL